MPAPESIKANPPWYWFTANAVAPKVTVTVSGRFPFTDAACTAVTVRCWWFATMGESWYTRPEVVVVAELVLTKMTSRPSAKSHRVPTRVARFWSEDD
jgi:hypothetical protein